MEKTYEMKQANGKILGLALMTIGGASVAFGCRAVMAASDLVLQAIVAGSSNGNMIATHWPNIVIALSIGVVLGSGLLFAAGFMAFKGEIDVQFRVPVKRISADR